jgi:hypothetical protein
MTARKPGPVIPENYAKALGAADPIEVLSSTPDNLRKLLRGLTERQLAKRPAPGKWSIKEIVAHLADGEAVLGFRYRYVAAHDRPALPGYDQDAFVVRLGVDRARTQDLLDDFAMLRAANIGLLERLPEEALLRVGVHSERGEESILQMVMMYAGHDRWHVSQVETLRVGLFPAKKKAPAKKAARKGAKKTAKKTANRKTAKKKTAK